MKIVINGGGIAGFALAHFLSDRGMIPIVIERAPGFSALGHVISLKAEGVHVLDRLGIRAACEARAQPNTTMMTFSTAGGIPLRTMQAGQFDTAIGGYLALRRSICTPRSTNGFAIASRSGTDARCGRFARMRRASTSR